VTVLVFGGAGFVGLNLVEALLKRGRSVVMFDRGTMPEAAQAAFRDHPGRFGSITGNVTDRAAVEAAIQPGIETVVFGAAITAGAAREAADPGAILRVNLLSLVPILERAKAVGVRRIVNLSSASADGRAVDGPDRLDETVPTDPVSLYAISKFASERVGARLAELWELDLVNVRLSAVFGPWERATGVRDTLSPQFQIMQAAQRGKPALLSRPGRRDWVYAPDVANALLILIDAARPRHALYNISSPMVWPVLAWGENLAALRPGFTCRLAAEGETPTIDLHSPQDRARLSVARMREEFGWSAQYGLDESVCHLDAWWHRHC
jgi:UDP-glucose 4-epimerase